MILEDNTLERFTVGDDGVQVDSHAREAHGHTVSVPIRERLTTFRYLEVRGHECGGMPAVSDQHPAIINTQHFARAVSTSDAASKSCCT